MILLIAILCFGIYIGGFISLKIVNWRINRSIDLQFARYIKVIASECGTDIEKLDFLNRLISRYTNDIMETFDKISH